MIEMLEMMWVFTPLELKVILGTGIVLMAYFIIKDTKNV